MFNSYDQLRNRIGCACFTESPTSPYMWSKYGDEYSGFVASFLIDPKKSCCCCEKSTCVLENTGYSSLVFILCPVLYDGRFDMSELAFEFATPRIEPPYPNISMFISLVHSTIHKTREWSNQNEWHLFTWPAPNSCPNHCYARLAAEEIIIGPRADNSAAKQLTNIGKIQGIPVRRAVIDVHSRSEELQIV